MDSVTAEGPAERAPFWSLHAHSRFSVNDAMPGVPEMVARAVELRYPALGLTDHGNVSGCAQVYKACRKAGIEPLPGVELYITADRENRQQGHNLHLTVASYSERGYRNLVRLNNLAHSNFYFKPRLDLADLAQAAEDGLTQGLVVASGCFFGLLSTTLREQGEKAAIRLAKTLDSWFPAFYVELQNHGVVHEEDGSSDDDLVAALVEVADRAGLPYLITNDSHYVHAEQQPLHDALKELVSFSDEPGEATFPGDGYHMVDREWLSRYFEPDVLERAITNGAELAEMAHCRLPEFEQFAMQVPDVTFGGDPYEVLERRVLDWAREQDNRAYLRRMGEELDIIESSGMSGYLLLVAEVCDFMRSKGIWYRVRGSASNSLACLALGITQLDPIRWGLRMERFLSRDRTKPPDVDLDIEHTRKPEVGEWLASRYDVEQIGTFMSYSLFDEDEDEAKGSLRVKFFSTMRKKGLSPVWRDVPRREREQLEALASMRLLSGYGTHPAGWAIAPDKATLEQLPLVYQPNSKIFITAYDKDDVEDAGFVKLDMLGLKELTALRVACEAAGVDPDDFPLDDAAVYKRLASGDTEGVFQLRGKAVAPWLPRMKPTRFSDVIAAMALFRPQAMGPGAHTSFIARRKGTEPVPEHHADIVAETKATYGLLLYQEQTMGVLRRIGMDVDELDKMLKAIKASGKRSMESARATIEDKLPRVRELAGGRGWSEEDISWLVEALLASVEYGFNQGHATAYGLMAYHQAYLAVHHPLEFWLGALVSSTGSKKEVEYLRAARNHGVRVLGPHVNRSGITYAIDRERGVIRKGLLSINGIGKTAAAELTSKAPFTSLADLGQRCIPRYVSGAKALALNRHPDEAGGVVAALLDAGALDELAMTPGGRP